MNICRLINGAKSIFIFIALLYLYFPVSDAQNPPAISIVSFDQEVGQYDKFECKFNITAEFENPYDYDEIAITGQFSSPNGIEYAVDGFYMEEFNLNQANGSLSPTGNSGFRIRFAPMTIGTWNLVLNVRDKNGTTSLPPIQFFCTAANQDNSGFARTINGNYLQLDNGDPLILIGENMAWDESNPYLDYSLWLTQLSSQGGNYIRLWHAHWGLGIEWKSNWSQFLGLRRYKETNCFYQDWLFDFCADNNIYVMLALQHHGPVSSQVNPDWNDSPYNQSNGGPCQNPGEFFSDVTARDHTKNRFRYIVARWGYAKSILAWELFNEVDWTDNYNINKENIQSWHREMSTFLKNIDPYKHLVTTSYAHTDQDPAIWNFENIDFTQTHVYINSGNIEKTVSSEIRNYLSSFRRPTMNGEFGLGASPHLSNEDPDGIHLHNALWTALFSGSVGTAMSWWWDLYVDPQDLYYHFSPINIVSQQIPFIEKNYSPGISYLTDAPGDLLFVPNLDWGAKGDENIMILNNGLSQPASPRLGKFLYGSQWNTEFRSPPTFHVTYQSDDKFVVRTGSEMATDPKISIYLDDVLILNEVGKTNEEYSVAISAGEHRIRVDNLGTDWISVSSYTFVNAGTQGNTYTLIAGDRKSAAGWMHNHQYNHQFIVENGFPDIIQGATLNIENMEMGTYEINWHECLSGTLLFSEEVLTAGELLAIPVPDLTWDLTYTVELLNEAVGTKDYSSQLSFDVYPNPIKAGNGLELDFSIDVDEIAYSIFNSEGRVLLKGINGGDVIKIPQSWIPGYYWIKCWTGHRSAVKGFVVE